MIVTQAAAHLAMKKHPDWSLRRCVEATGGADLTPGPRSITGHGLQGEGDPFNADGSRSRDGSGSGMCACGELSESLSTVAGRKRWHREHKADVLAAKEMARG